MYDVDLLCLFLSHIQCYANKFYFLSILLEHRIVEVYWLPIEVKLKFLIASEIIFRQWSLEVESNFLLSVRLFKETPPSLHSLNQWQEPLQVMPQRSGLAESFPIQVPIGCCQFI